MRHVYFVRLYRQTPKHAYVFHHTCNGKNKQKLTGEVTNIEEVEMSVGDDEDMADDTLDGVQSGEGVASDESTRGGGDDSKKRFHDEDDQETVGFGGSMSSSTRGGLGRYDIRK